MSSVSPNGSGPFPLYQVLEAEYIALHGPLPRDDDQNEADPEKRLAAILAVIHTQKPSALCISGGGIRSATFVLGVLAVILRGLQEHGSPTIMTLLLVGSAVLGAISISFIGLNRPSGANRNQTQAKYLVTCLAPLVGSAVALTLFWALHHRNSRTQEEWYWFLVFGEAVNLLGHMFGTLTSRKSGIKQKMYELGAVVLTGAVTD